MKKPTVLIVEDEKLIAFDLKKSLEAKNFSVFPVIGDAQKAVEYTITHEPDVIIMDIFLKGKESGIDAAREINKKKPTPIIYLTGNLHMLLEEEIEATNPAAFLTKPCTDLEIIATIEKVLSEHKM